MEQKKLKVDKIRLKEYKEEKKRGREERREEREAAAEPGLKEMKLMIDAMATVVKEFCRKGLDARRSRN